MKKNTLTLSLIAGLLAPFAANAAVLANFDGTSLLSVAPPDPNMSLTGLIGGDGVTDGLSVFSSNGSYYDARSAVNNDSLPTPQVRLDTAFKNLAYISFTLSADPGYALDISSFSFDGAKGGSSSRVIGVASSIDNDFSALALQVSPTLSWIYAADPISTSASNNIINNTDPGASYQGLSSLTFLVAVDGSNALRLDDFVVEGTVSVVPEPSTYAIMAGFMALGLVMVRRRMKA